MAVPFMSRQSGFNNNNRFGNQRTMTPSAPMNPGLGQRSSGGAEGLLPRGAVRVAPPAMAPGSNAFGRRFDGHDGGSSMSSASWNDPRTQANIKNTPRTPPAAPRVDGREAGIAAMRGYVNPAANGPTKPLRAPNGPGGVQSYGGLVGRGSITPRVPDVSNFNVSLDSSGRPNGSPLPPTPPRVKATFEDPGATGPNKALNGMTSNDFRNAQATFAQRRGFGTGTPNMGKEMPSLSPEAKRIIGNQGAVADANMKKYGTDNPQEASRAMWRERAFRQGMTRRGINAPQQRMAADNYMGRTADPRDPKNGGEPFKGASREFGRGSVQGQKPFISADPANSDDPNVSGKRPTKPVKPLTGGRPGHSGPRKPGGFVNHGD